MLFMMMINYNKLYSKYSYHAIIILFYLIIIITLFYSMLFIMHRLKIHNFSKIWGLKTLFFYMKYYFIFLFII
jgi:hypothetical protein